MPFYRMDLEDGKTCVVHMNLGRRRGPAPCVGPRLETDDPTIGERCGRMSVALCDAPAGQDLAGKELTCDAPVCDRHRERVGADRDLCWRHRRQPDLPAAGEAGA